MTLKWYILSLKLVQKFKHLSVVQLRKLAALYPARLISRLPANVKQHNQVIAFAFEVKHCDMPIPIVSQLLRSGWWRHRCIFNDEFGKPGSYLQALGAIFDYARSQCNQLCYRFCGIWPSTRAYLRSRAYLHGGYLDLSGPCPHPFRIWYYRLAFNFVPRLSSFRMDWCGVFYLYWYSLLTYC